MSGADDFSNVQPAILGSPQASNKWHLSLLQHVVESYEVLTKRSFYKDFGFTVEGSLTVDQAMAIWQSTERVLVVHATASRPDRLHPANFEVVTPAMVFVYANLAGLAQFGYGWRAPRGNDNSRSFIGLDSRKSAAETDQADRNRLFRAVRDNGFALGYEGTRLHRSGAPFRITADVWRVTLGGLPGGELIGEAASFQRVPVS